MKAGAVLEFLLKIQKFQKLSLKYAFVEICVRVVFCPFFKILYRNFLAFLINGNEYRQ
jgi:hypothetical protein